MAGRHRRLDAKQWTEVKVLFEVGVPVKRLSLEYGISDKAIYAKAKRSEWSIRLDEEVAQFLHHHNSTSIVELLKLLEKEAPGVSKEKADLKQEIARIEEVGSDSYFREAVSTTIRAIVEIEARHRDEWDTVGGLLDLAEMRRKSAEADAEEVRAAQDAEDNANGVPLSERKEVTPDYYAAQFLVRYAKEYASVITMKQTGERKLYRMDDLLPSDTEILPFDIKKLSDDELAAFRSIASKMAG